MKKIVILFSVLFIFSSCNGQEVKEKTNEGEANLNEVKPKESWSVDREFDEDGNLIKLDSTYSWSFSSDGKEISSKTVDSLMNSFRSRFDSDFPSKINKNFFDFFAQDSFGEKSFLQDDFFMNNWNSRMEEMEKMMKRSDSIHKFFLDGFRDKK